MQTEKSYINLDHSNQVLTQISELWKSKLLCDATIEVGPVKVYTHRLVLVASCPWLATLLGKDEQTVSNLEIKLPNHVGIDALNSLLSYLYHGELNLNQTNFRQIEKLANILKVPKVKKYCQEFCSYLRSLERSDTDEITPSDEIPTTYNIDIRKSTLVITCKENTSENYIGRSLINTPINTRTVNNTPKKATTLKLTSKQSRSPQEERTLRNIPQQVRDFGNSPQQTSSPLGARSLSTAAQQTISPQTARVLSYNAQQTRNSQGAKGLSKNTQQTKSPQRASILGNNAQQTRSPQRASILGNNAQQTRSPQRASILGNNAQQTKGPQRASILNNTPQQTRKRKYDKVESFIPKLSDVKIIKNNVILHEKENKSHDHSQYEPGFQENVNGTEEIKKKPGKFDNFQMSLTPNKSDKSNETCVKVPVSSFTDSCNSQNILDNHDSRPIYFNTNSIKQEPQSDMEIYSICSKKFNKDSSWSSCVITSSLPSSSKDSSIDQPGGSYTCDSKMIKSCTSENRQDHVSEYVPSYKYDSRLGHTTVYVTSALTHNGTETTLTPSTSLNPSNLTNISNHKYHLSTNGITSKGKTTDHQLPVRQPTALVSEINGTSTQTSSVTLQVNSISSLDSSRKKLRFLLPAQGNGTTSMAMSSTTSTVTCSQNSNQSVMQSKTFPVAMTTCTLTYNKNAKPSTAVISVSTPASALTHLQNSSKSDPQLTTIHIVRTTSSLVNSQKTSHFTSAPVVGLTRNDGQYLFLPSMRSASENNCSQFYMYRPNNPGMLLSPNNRMFLPVAPPQIIVCPTASSGLKNTQMPSTFSFANSPNVLSTNFSSQGPLLLQPMSFVVPKNTLSSEIPKSASKTKEINETLFRGQDQLTKTTVPSTSVPLVSLLNTRQSSLTSTLCTHATIIPNNTSVIRPSIVSQKPVGENTANLHSAVTNSEPEILPLLSMPVLVSDSEKNVYKNTRTETKISGVGKENKQMSMNTETSEIKDVNINCTSYMKMPVQKVSELEVKCKSVVESKSQKSGIVSNDPVSLSEEEDKSKKVQAGLSQSNQSNENKCHMIKKTNAHLTGVNQSNLAQKTGIPSSSDHQHTKTTTESLKRKHNCLSSADTAMECSVPKLRKIITKSNGDSQLSSGSLNKTRLSESVKEKLVSGLQKFGKRLQDVKKASRVDQDNSKKKENQRQRKTDQSESTAVCKKSKTPGDIQKMSINKPTPMIVKTKGAVILKKKPNQELVCSVTPVNNQSNHTSKSYHSVKKEVKMHESKTEFALKTNQVNGNKQTKTNETSSVRSNQEKAILVRSNQEKADLVRSNQDNSSSVRSNQEKASSVRSNQEKSDLVRSNQEKASSVRSNQEKASSARSKQEKADLVRSNQEKADLVRSNQEKASSVWSNQEKLSLVRSNQEKADLVRSNQDNSSSGRSNQKKADLVRSNQEKASSVRSNQEKASSARSNQEKADLVWSNQVKVSSVRSNQEKASSFKSNQEKASSVRSNQEKASALRGKIDNKKQLIDTQQSLQSNLSLQSNESSGYKSYKNKVPSSKVFQNIEIKKQAADTQPSLHKSKQSNEGLEHGKCENNVNVAVSSGIGKQKTEAGAQTINTRRLSISRLPVQSSDLSRNKSSGYEQIYLHSREEKNLNSGSVNNDFRCNGTTKATAEKNVDENKPSSVKDKQGTVTSKQKYVNNKDESSIAKNGDTSNEESSKCREGSKNVSEKEKSKLNKVVKYEEEKSSNTENNNTGIKNNWNMITMNVKGNRHNSAMGKQQHKKVSWNDRFRDNNKITNNSVTKQTPNNINTLESYYTANYSNKEKTNGTHTEGQGHVNHIVNVKQSNSVVTTTVAMVSNSSSGQIYSGAGDSRVIPSTTPLALLANSVKEKIKDPEKFPFPTSWGVGVFREWLIHKGLSPLFEYMEIEALDDVLMEFYPDIKSQECSTLFSGELHIIRNAIIKHLESSNQLITNNCKGLLYSNAVFEELTNEKCLFTTKGPIRTDDFKKLYRSQVFSDLDPVSLQRKVWFEVTLFLNEHWKSMIDAMLSLKKDSFILCTDANGKHYYEIRPDASWNNNGREGKIGHHQGRVRCPVQVLEFYLSKLHPNCNAFFQKPNLSVKQHKFWYLPNPLCKCRLKNMMSQISIDAKLSCIYTNTAVKTTSVSLLQNCTPNQNYPT